MNLFILSPFVIIVLGYTLLGKRSSQPSICPASEDIQSDFVKEEYQEHKHAGFYYELAFKDATQPRGCKCITSNKTIVSNNTLRDAFNIQCAGRIYHCALSFDLNVDPSRRGYMIGRWNNFSLAKDISFPNTIVDVGVNKATGEYDWIIELQCKQTSVLGFNWIQYYGLNFYSKTYTNQLKVVGEMIRVARERGLGDFIESGLALYLVEHTPDCLIDH
jgi:hypothetical protein